MNSDQDFTILLLILLGLMLIVGFVLGYDFGKDKGKHSIRVEAVKAAAADWIVSPEGATVFQWKSATEAAVELK